MSRRWRQPTVIWLKSVKKNRYWKKRRTVRSYRLRVPWMSLSLYAVALTAAALVLMRIPAGGGATLPVTSHVGTSRSWIDKTLAGSHSPSGAIEAWFNAGFPLAAFSKPRPFSLHLGSLMMTGIAEITGVHLVNLQGLMTMGMPELASVKAPPVTRVDTPPKKPSRPKSQEAVDKTLPGDGGRVWAELGSKPLVGIYQTHSHESFWSEVGPGTTTAYSTKWSTTIVQVGWWLAQDLHQEGVGAIQSRVDNMSEGLLASYNKSFYTARQLLRWYPSVGMLVDLHRAPSNVAAVTVHGEKMAPIQVVVGSNKLLPNAHWHQNLEVAMKLAHELSTQDPGILRGRGIDMVPYRYNQQLMPADLLIEVGGPNSTLSEERYSVRELALAIASVMRHGGIPHVKLQSKEN